MSALSSVLHVSCPSALLAQIQVSDAGSTTVSMPIWLLVAIVGTIVVICLFALWVAKGKRNS